MKKWFYAGLFFMFPWVTWAQKSQVITQIITYKVNLRLDENLSGDAFSDPYFVYGQLNAEWYQNKLSPQEFPLFVKTIHQAVCNGKITVYDPIWQVDGYRPVFTKYTLHEAKSIGTDTIIKTLQYPYPPYDDFDTMVVYTFDPLDIVQVEFMEKWTLNTKTMEIKKTPIAYALWRKRMDLQTGEFRGLSRMYWIRSKKQK